MCVCVNCVRNHEFMLTSPIPIHYPPPIESFFPSLCPIPHPYPPSSTLRILVPKSINILFTRFYHILPQISCCFTYTTTKAQLLQRVQDLFAVVLTLFSTKGMLLKDAFCSDLCWLLFCSSMWLSYSWQYNWVHLFRLLSFKVFFPPLILTD
uniref:Uncharacterized protein n=1 Tax=Rousettus aegyptiacus TaxID=9407 RepID=A0A7J8D6S3_ROUAE|nr:hypothetical protein HJG63_008787 [Rousettus aegyptiacus]